MAWGRWGEPPREAPAPGALEGLQQHAAGLGLQRPPRGGTCAGGTGSAAAKPPPATALTASAGATMLEPGLELNGDMET